MRIAPILLSALLLTLAACSQQAVVQRGDTVFITYTGSFQNGTVFDSNDPASSALFPDAPPAKFTPMLVKVGGGTLIPGFENALIGMGEGETRNVTIKATQAYGGYDPEKTVKVPHVVAYPFEDVVQRTVVAPIEPIAARLGNATRSGAVFETTNFRYNITKMNATHALLYLIETRNATIELEGRPWSSTLARSNASALVFRADVEDGDVIRTTEGSYGADVAGGEVTLTSTYSIGQVVMRQDGARGRVSAISDSAVTIDFNHPLAGYDLVFTIRVDTLQPRSEA